MNNFWLIIWNIYLKKKYWKKLEKKFYCQINYWYSLLTRNSTYFLNFIVLVWFKPQKKSYKNIILFKVNYVKRMQLGGVIVWSYDMDDKTGTLCNQGPYPVLTTLRNELIKPDPPTTPSPSAKSGGKVSSFPRGFWSKRPRHGRSFSNSIHKSNLLFLIFLYIFLLTNVNHLIDLLWVYIYIYELFL